MYNIKLFKIKAITNLHVGSGQANYAVIDNLVQRDPLDNKTPCINSSSLKGAFREYIKYKNIVNSDENAENPGSKMIRAVFGSEPKDDDNSNKPGYLEFSTAHLLAIPIRSNIKPYFLATAPYLLKRFLDICEIFDIEIEERKAIDALLQENGNYISLNINDNSVILEDIENIDFKDLSCLENILDCSSEEIALISDKEMLSFCEHLPVIARNHLENGESKNLFYEEIVPRESLFYFTIQEPYEKLINSEDIENIAEYFQNFYSWIQERPIHIGANATIGYGLCDIEEVTE